MGFNSGFKGLNRVDLSFFVCGSVENIHFTEKNITRILSVFDWDITCGEV